MAYILSNTLLALLEFPGATLLGINRMLSDKEYRKVVVANIKDPSVRSFWVDEFGKYTDKYAAEATPAIQNKVGQFTSNPLIRNIIGQPKSSFDIRKIMDDKKIFIINLSKGRVGEGNANLLGSMLITKIYLAAMSRADATETTLARLPDFYLYVDEFQSFANKSFADILSEARKYKLNLTIAHQYIEQMEDEVRAAVFGNVGTMVAFRVGAFDAEVLEKEFAPQFTVEDLVNLGVFQVYLKLMIDGVTSLPFSGTTLPPIAKPAVSFKETILEASRKNFGRSRVEVEEAVIAFHAPITKPVPSTESVVKTERRDGAGEKIITSVSNPGLSVNKSSPTPAFFRNTSSVDRGNGRSNPSNFRGTPRVSPQIGREGYSGYGDRRDPRGNFRSGQVDVEAQRKSLYSSTPPNNLKPASVYPEGKKISAHNFSAPKSELSLQLPGVIKGALSLKDLKTTPPVPSFKEREEKNISELRQALSQVLEANKTQQKKTETVFAPNVVSVSNKTENKKEKAIPFQIGNAGVSLEARVGASEINKRAETKALEVPEDVLRKVLELPEEKR